VKTTAKIRDYLEMAKGPGEDEEHLFLPSGIPYGNMNIVNFYYIVN